MCFGCSMFFSCALGVQSDPAQLTVAGGDALVFGEALSAPGGMDRIRSRMGVCPQFDILWKELTGREHLRIYGAIKVGLPPVPRKYHPLLGARAPAHLWCHECGFAAVHLQALPVGGVSE